MCVVLDFYKLIDDTLTKRALCILIIIITYLFAHLCSTREVKSLM